MGLQPTPQPFHSSIEPESSVQEAVAALSADEKSRLRRYAQWRMRPIQGAVHHSDADDLVNEAVQRTLEGIRKWNPAEKTTFQHLLGAISSIADEWYKEMKRYTEFSDVQASPESVHAQLLRKMALQRVRRRLKGDVLAIAVFESLLNDEKPSEAIKTLNIPKKVYESARRRVLRKGQKALSHTQRAKV